MKLVEFPLQKAIHARLTTGANKLDVPVYDEVPENQAYPYVEIGEILTSEFPGKCKPMTEAEVPFHIWDSRGDVGGSNYRINEIGNDIMTAITICRDVSQSFLSMDDHTVVRQDFESMSHVKNIDSSIRHGILTLTFLIEED